MKTAQDVLDYISTFYQAATEDPRGFFLSVEQMEAELSHMESLYEFIVDDSRSYPPGGNQFIKFLYDNGYNALGFTNGKRGEDAGDNIRKFDSPKPSEVARMKEFASFWNEYMASDTRLSAAGNKTGQKGL